jgi:methionyl-tRNA synthetase
VKNVPANWVEEKLNNDAIRMRAQIAAANRRFEATLAAIKERLDVKKREKLEEISKQIMLFRDELDRRATREAQQEVQNTLDELGIQLAESATWELPEVSSTKQTAEFSPTGLSRQVPLTSISKGPSLASDLRLFLKVRRYELGIKGVARDVTREFLAWRREINRGP